MKKIILIALAIILYNISYAQIQMNSSGRVGIGQYSPNNNYRLTLADMYFCNAPYPGLIIKNTPGNAYNKAIYPTSNYQCQLGLSDKRFKYVYCYDLVEGSDKREKENIRDINNALDIILQLKGVKYDLKKEIAYNDSAIKNLKIMAKLETGRKNKIGFLAQDVEKILPEVVIHDDSTDAYGIEYTKIVAVLVEAIKEQQTIIESLQSEIKELQKQSNNNKLKSTSISNNASELQSDSENALYQNYPNPFKESTRIEYYLSSDIRDAMINIYDMNGTQLKSIELHQNEYGNITINGGEFNAGMYMYALIADRQVIDTKRMILTD